MKVQTIQSRTYVAIALLILGLLVSTIAYASEGQEKVTVCHKGSHEISVGEPAVAAHLAHGDTVGTCDGGGGGGPDPI